MSDDSADLDKLDESVGDGGSIDWDEIARLPADHELRKLADLYRVIAEVGNVHRSGLDDISRPPDRPSDQISTKTPLGHQAATPPGSPDGATLGKWGHLV